MSKLQAGLGITTITPPMGVEMSGYGYYLNRRCDGVMADLYSKALVLDDGDTRVAIVANDIIGVDKDITSRTRALVEANTGIPPEHVLLACSHTHSGPATIFLRGCGEVDRPYVEMLIRLMASAVMMANSALEPVTMRVGSGHLDNMSHNRVVQGSPIDPEVGVVSFYREDSRLLAVLANFSCHSVTLGGGNRKISPDYCGATANIVESIFPESKMLFLQGSCGDVNPRMRGAPEQAGTLLAGEVLKTIVTSDEVENVTLSAASKLIGLPLVPPDISEVRRTLEVNKAKLESTDTQGSELVEARFLTDWAESMFARLTDAKGLRLKKLSGEPETKLNTEIQVIKLGNIALACNPSELFTEFALKIKQQAKMKTFNIGYANDFVGYIPDRGDFERGGYAAARVPLICDNFPFEVDVGDVLVEEVINLI